MAKRDQKTTMGGPGGSFQSTQWSQLRRAKTSNEERRRVAVNNLLQRYWRPVYCYLRRKGYSNEHAKDLTQGFFCEVVLGRQLIQQADEARGRFRTFLLTALDRYVTSAYRKEAAAKRLPKKGLEQLECVDIPDSALAFASTSPETAFCYAWATALLDQVLA
jgi:DNA-directed RNA polymerase specialized sigma24 family protein